MKLEIRSRDGDRPSILERFASVVANAPDAAALICAATGEVTTRAQLQARAAELRVLLESQGVRRGFALAVQTPNSVDFVALFLATLQLDGTFVPIDRDAKQNEIAAILQQFELSALAYHAGSGEPAILLRSSVAPSRLADAALLKLTSGSTGSPKGILTSQQNLIADCENICATMEIAPDDINFGAIPFSHSYGFSNLVTPLLLQGTAVVFSNDYLPLAVVENCNRYGVTVMPGIPLMFDHLSRLPESDGRFQSARTFISAGAPLSAEVSRAFRERFGAPIHTFYGCSECGGITYDREGAAVERGNVGSAMHGVTLHVDPSTERLRVRSKAVANGYLDAPPDETMKFSAGAFLTDDLVRIDAEGIVTMEGRVGDLINTAGKKVNPREIELVIQQIPGVRQVKVYGEPAGARGEVVAAAVVAQSDVTREEIRSFCRSRLSSHKVPRIVKLIEAIPVDERGKFKRSALLSL